MTATSRVNWWYYPKSDEVPHHLLEVTRVFDSIQSLIGSHTNELPSNSVLAAARPGLEALGYLVETSKLASGKIGVPVLFGRNGVPEKSFEADAIHRDSGTVIEVEAGRAVTNNQFLKDLFEACMMHDVHYAVIAVRNQYRRNPDFERVCAFFDTLYASRRLSLPLKGVLVLGY